MRAHPLIGVVSALLRFDFVYLQFYWDMVNLNDVDRHGHTLLMHACSVGDERFVGFLIDNGARTYGYNERGETVADVIANLPDVTARHRVSQIVFGNEWFAQKRAKRV